jgi:recombination protein RecR
MLPESVQNLIDEFSKLPGIGPKSAARLTFYLLTKPAEEISQFGMVVVDLIKDIKYCKECYNITDQEICRVCSDDKRNKKLLAVVEEPLDVIVLEKSGAFDGIYHVLGGHISPLDGIGPEQLRIKQLIDRLKVDGVKEVILATNPDLEGEATASYIKEQISDKGIKVEITRIARGLPVGGDIEYADEITLKRSLEGRRSYE